MTYGGSLTVLNVAEKPSVARALASVFDQIPQSRNQPPIPNQAAQIFVIDNVQFPSITTQGSGTVIQHNNSNSPHKMIVTSVRGHLAAQDFPQNYGWNSCAPKDLFEAPIETFYRDDKVPLERMLKNQSRNVDAVILWLDCDREGEAICDEVRTVCLQSGNQRLRGDRIYRAKFSTVLPQEIKRALRSLGRVNECFVQAVQARSEHDLRVGAAFTRFQTMRLQKKFEEFASGNMGVVSYGPCQFPTLGFVVERWARIETFVPQDFWYLDMTINVTDDGTITGMPQNENIQPNGQQHNSNISRNKSRQLVLKWQRERLYDRSMTLALYESCLDVGEAEVKSLTGRPKNKWRPIPLATVELQKRASRYLRIGSETLMTAAEELYQQGLISYPRTETEKFRPEFQHRPLIESFQGIGGEFGEYSSKLLRDDNFQNPRAGPNDDAAHPPITPCKAVHPDSIPDMNQRKIYTLIVKHYLACCSRDAVGRETVLKVRMASEEFSAKGLMILERNWLEIYAPWEKWYTGHGELPSVQVGTRFTPSSLLMKDGHTVPPQLISEVELISLMDRNGIGTDATIATHITTIQERNYAEKNAAQKFSPTKLGIALVEGYNSMGFKLNRPDLRREMEAECNAVASGRKRKEDIMEPILKNMRDCFEAANAEAHKLDNAIARHFTRLGANNTNYDTIQANFSKCGTCQGFLAFKQLSGGGNNARSNPKLLQCSTCSMGFRLPSKGIPTPSVQADRNNQPNICPICQYQVVKVSQGEGYNGNGYTICPKCYNDAPIQYGGGATSGDFRCFNCTHPTCTLATGTRDGGVEVFPCPFCAAHSTSGKITLRKTSRGHILSCSNSSTTAAGRARCEYKIWLPKAASSVTIAESQQTLNNHPNNTTANNGATNPITCNRCSNGTKTVKKLSFRWNPNKIPPGIPTQQVACVLCDEGLKNDFQINIPQLNQVQIRGRQRSRTASSSLSSPTATTLATSSTLSYSSSWNHSGGRGRGGNGRSSGGGSVNSGRGRGSPYGGTSSRSTSQSRERFFPNSQNNNYNNQRYSAGRSRSSGGGSRSTSTRSKNSSNDFHCYKCGQVGHYASSCPN